MRLFSFACILGFLCLLVECTAAAKFQGSLVDGVGVHSLNTGGSTLSVTLQAQRFRTDLDSLRMAEVLSSGFVCGDVSDFETQIQRALVLGQVTVSNSGRLLRLRLGPMPNFTLPKTSSFSFFIPSSFFSAGFADSSFRLGFESRIFVGAMASATVLTQELIVGAPVHVQFSGVSPSVVNIVQGATCRGDLAKISNLQVGASGLEFVPLRGGPVSFCYHDGNRQMQLSGVAFVSGAEGFSVDPTPPRAGKQFYIHLFGAEMTEQDALILSRSACGEVDLKDFDAFDFEFSSPSRAGLFVVVSEASHYNVCYQHSGSGVFVSLGFLNVDKGGDTVIEGDSRELNVEQDTLVTRNARIDHLLITAGTLMLDHFHLNISRFEWTGGSILGPGVITVMGDKSYISAQESIVIHFSLRNLGRLEIRFGVLLLAEGGSVTNYHRLVVDASGITEGQDVVLDGQHDGGLLRNAVSGTVIIRGVSGAKLDIRHSFANFGRVVVGEGSVLWSAFIGYRGSVMEIASGVFVTVTGGVLQGEYQIGEESVLAIRTLPKRSVEISGASFRLSESSLIEVLSGDVLFSSSRFEGPGVVSFGASPGLTLRLDGTSIFSFRTAVGFSHTHLLSPHGCILSFYGNIAMNLENTVVGDNVVLQSRLAAVMFAKGHDRTNMIPQRAPQNTSLVVPANTTLVVIDTGNRTQEELLTMSATPVVCSYYVVVPMFVAADGDILLQGCAMLPYGGTLNGVIYGSSLDVLEASIKTAFCKTALFGGDGCVGTTASGVHSGLVLRGTFATSGPEDTRFDINYLRLSNATLDVGRPLSLRAPLFHIEPDSSLILTNGGLLAVDSFVLRGLLQSGGDLAIKGDFDARGGVLRLSPSSDCYFPMTVDGEVMYENTLVQCSVPPLTPTTGALVRSASFVGEPAVDQPSCSSSSQLLARLLLDQQSGLTLVVAEDAFELPTMDRFKLLAFGAAAVASIMWAMGFEAPRELFGRPPLVFDLLWTEFSMFIPNIVAALGYGLEIVLLCSPAFLHSVPNTFILGWFSKMGSALIEPRASASAPPLSVISAFLVFVWALSWLPLSGHVFRNQVADEGRWPMQRQSMRLLFQLHTVAVVVSPPLFVPMLSVLLETVACSTLYSEAPSCGHMQIFYWPFLVAAVLLVCLSPFSGVNRSFPFSHPPYQRDLDIRFKRSYVFTRSAILSLLVLLWKIAGTSRVFLLCGSLGLQGLLFAVTYVSQPSGYRNVNIFVSMALLYPIWAHVAALFSEFHSTQSSVCPDTDYAFSLMIVVGWVLISIAVYRGSGDVNADFGEDTEIGMQLKMIVEGSARLEESRSDMYNAVSEKEREAISRNISSLKLHHLHHLTIFRHKKESFLLIYYLGEEVGRTHYSATDPVLPAEDAPGFDPVLKTAAVAISEPEMSPLTVDLMDSYVRGPQLGSGSYGAVYMGMLSATGRLVAVKEVRISTKKKDALSQVKKEVDFLRCLSHPNIVQYFGCRTKGGIMQVFMEFATGGSLTSLVRKFGLLHEPVVGMYANQILTGLAYLHSKGIVHRDIKGDNILIDNCGVAKLADFGCSKMLADMANTSEEGCGTLIGSPYWMAPEVIRSEAYGTKADIWSIGCTVVEMLNGGEPAWREKFETAYAAMYFIGHSTDQYPTNIPETVSESCRDFLSKCFEREVSKRADAIELLSHPWLREAQAVPFNPADAVYSSPASVSMESMARSESPTADASFEREMSSFS